MRAVDERDVRERLWEVAERFTSLGVELFAEETDVIGLLKHALEDLLRLLLFADEGKRFSQPERADRENALFSR